MPGGGEDLGQSLPEAESPIADRQDRGTHSPAGAVAQQVRPGLARFTVAVLERDQLLAAVRPHPDEDEHAGSGLLQANVEVDAVGPHIHVVDLGEVAVHEGGMVGLPLLGQPGDRGRGQPGRASKELLQRGHEVARGQAVQVEQRKNLADLRALAAPGRQDRGGEPLALARGLVDALVVHPRRLHLDRAGRGGDLSGLVIAVSDHQAAPLIVALISQLGYVRVDFGLQCGGQHPSRTLQDDLVDQGGAVGGGAVVVHYSEHGRAFPAGAANTGLAR